MKTSRERAMEAFRRVFGRDPDLGARAPGRVNLIGEHIDYCGGTVLPFAIEQECVAVGGLGGRGVRLYAADLDEWLECDVSELGAPGVFRGWRAYAAGMLSCVPAAVGRSFDGCEGVIASDVPRGSGLSSSAAFEMALGWLVGSLLGEPVEGEALARIGYRVEHEFAGVPCGIMDQCASAMGRRGHAMLLDCASERIIGHVPMPCDEELAILVVDTRVRHTHAGGEYASRRLACEAAAAKLGVEHLCRATIEQVEGLGVTLRPIGEHAVRENGRTRDAVKALELKDWESLGRVINASHDSLRDFYRVSCTELDAVVDVARGVPGVIGARMTGGGFGGCAIVLTLPKAFDSATHAIRGAFQARFGRDCAIMRARACDGASLRSLA